VTEATAPLSGLRIIELAGIGPGPFAGMMLADMGADVVCLDRFRSNRSGHGILFRSRRSLAIDLKAPGAAQVVLRLCVNADGVIETFRPGVAERLGIGPGDCLGVNPALVYGRMTGWGQEGPMASEPGHDINYIALTGALHAIGRAGGPPVAPLNLVGDFGGGGMLLAFGMLAGILAARRTGNGSVVDAAMIDGASALMAMFYGFHSEGRHRLERGTNTLDTGAPFYDVYRTRDAQWVSIGAIEPKFWTGLTTALGLTEDVQRMHHDEASRPAVRAALEARIGELTRAELDELLIGQEACYAPVLSLEEAPRHPHNVARGTFVEVDGVVQAAPAPRFNGAPPTTPRTVRRPGADTVSVLGQAGYTEHEIAKLLSSGVVAEPPAAAPR
jgi:alpha-methylacyl-CoA racemase